MSKGNKKTKAEQIYKYYLEHPHESLRSIGRKFKTSHSQVRRILERNNVYPRYKLCNTEDTLNVSFTKKLNVNVKKFNKTAIVLADLHIPYHDETVVNAVLNYCVDLKPSYVIYLGDILDFYQVSFWNKDPKGFDLEEELIAGREFFRLTSQELFKKASHYYIEGNHEQRLRRYLFSKAPELSNLRALQLSAPDMLNLYNYDVEYVILREWMQTYNEPFKLGNLYLLHGHEFSTKFGAVYVARRAVLRTLSNVMVGHSHVAQEHIEKSVTSGSILGGWSVGCLCDLYPDFSPLNGWIHGFAEIRLTDDGNFVVFNHKVRVKDNEVMIF